MHIRYFAGSLTVQVMLELLPLLHLKRKKNIVVIAESKMRCFLKKKSEKTIKKTKPMIKLLWPLCLPKVSL